MLALAIALTAAPLAHAVPAELTHSGRLLDANGAPIHGNLPVTVRLWDHATAGSTRWTWTGDVDFADGYFSIALTGGTPTLSAQVLDAPALWIGLAVDGGAELSRAPIASVAYALRARDVDGGTVTAQVVRLVDAAHSSTATCTGEPAGTLRYHHRTLELCTETGWRAVGSSEVDGPSCQAVHLGDVDLPSGIYTLDPDGSGPVAPFEAYCEMDTADGGWTLIARDRLNDGTLLHSTATTWPANAGGSPAGGSDHLLSAAQLAALEQGKSSFQYLIYATGTRSTAGQYITCLQDESITVGHLPAGGACQYDTGATSEHNRRGISIHAESGSCRFIAFWADTLHPGNWWQGSNFAEASSASCGWGVDYPHALGPNPHTSPYPQRNTDYTTWFFVR